MADKNYFNKMQVRNGETVYVRDTEAQSDISALKINKQDALSFDSIPTLNSNKPVTSNGIYQALQNNFNYIAGNHITITNNNTINVALDNTISANSEHPVSGSVINTALSDIQTQLNNKQPAGTYITNINNLTGSNISITGSNIAVSSNDNTTIATAINNLNTAINGITGDIGDITIGDENIIESISVNGSNISPDSNKNINITVPIIDNEFNEESNNALSSVGLYNLLKQCCYPIIYQQPEIPRAAIGDTINLYVLAQGYGLIYQWEKFINIENNPITVALGTTPNQSYTITQEENFDFDNTFFRCNIMDNFNNLVQTNTIFVTRLFNISFDANDGDGTMENLKIEQGFYFQLPENQFTYENHTFNGWAIEENGIKIYDNQSTVFPINDMILYAVWI